VPAIRAIEELAFPHPAERFSTRKVRYLIESPRAIVLVAELKGEVAGWASGFARTRSPRPWGRVFALAVNPKVHGQKLGERLLRRLMGELWAAGAQRLVLEVRPDNAAAIRLYERVGFTPRVLLSNFYAPGLDARRMIREKE
jgi:ribosomal protein S18 acetylase RimI-like enzyme